MGESLKRGGLRREKGDVDARETRRRGVGPTRRLEDVVFLTGSALIMVCISDSKAFLIHGGPQGAWEDSWSARWNPNGSFHLTSLLLFLSSPSFLIYLHSFLRQSSLSKATSLSPSTLTVQPPSVRSLQTGSSRTGVLDRSKTFSLDCSTLSRPTQRSTTRGLLLWVPVGEDTRSTGSTDTTTHSVSRLSSGEFRPSPLYPSQGWF